MVPVIFTHVEEPYTTRTSYENTAGLPRTRSSPHPACISYENTAALPKTKSRPYTTRISYENTAGLPRTKSRVLYHFRKRGATILYFTIFRTSAATNLYFTISDTKKLKRVQNGKVPNCQARFVDCVKVQICGCLFSKMVNSTISHPKLSWLGNATATTTDMVDYYNHCNRRDDDK